MQIFVIFFYIYLFKIFECDYVIYKNKWKVELKSSLVTFLPEFRGRTFFASLYRTFSLRPPHFLHRTFYRDQLAHPYTKTLHHSNRT